MGVYVLIGKTQRSLYQCVGVGHVQKHYIELMCLPSLDLKVSSAEAHTTVSDSLFQLMVLLIKKNICIYPSSVSYLNKLGARMGEVGVVIV